MKNAARTPLRFPRSPQVHPYSKNYEFGDTSKSSGTFSRSIFSRYIVVILVGRAVRGSEITWRLRLKKSILVCARRSEATTALFHSDVILGHIERQLIREAEQSGVALRFPPHSKNAVLEPAKG